MVGSPSARKDVPSAGGESACCGDHRARHGTVSHEGFPDGVVRGERNEARDNRRVGSERREHLLR